MQTVNILLRFQHVAMFVSAKCVLDIGLSPIACLHLGMPMPYHGPGMGPGRAYVPPNVLGRDSPGASLGH